MTRTVTGQLPRTASGTPSYSLAKSRIAEQADELLYRLKDEYGLTDLEMADILSGLARDFLGYAVRDQQKRDPSRRDAIGTPRE